MTAGAGGNVVPTSFYDQLIAHLIEVSGIMQAGATVLTTDSGESLQIPKTTAHSTGALTAEAAAIAASDPTFGQVTLGAFKYAVLVQVSNELITDTAVDLLGYLATGRGPQPTPAEAQAPVPTPPPIDAITPPIAPSAAGTSPAATRFFTRHGRRIQARPTEHRIRAHR